MIMQITPMYASAKTAAKLLDMKISEFLALVSNGILPRPKKLGPLERWDAEELRAICRGERIDGYEDVKW
jgi:predicted DNA-binding transcriptional regulator AlpA